MALNNLAAVTVPVGATIIVAANPRRKYLRITQTSANPIRVGGVGLTAATGTRLGQNESVVFEGKGIPTEAIYGIREGGVDGTIIALEY